MSGKNDERFEVYKLLWDRVSREVDEVYTINNVFLVMTGALLTGIVALFGKSPVHLLGGFAGCVLAWQWHRSLTRQLKWMHWWIAEAAAVEKQMGAPDIWLRVSGQVREGRLPPVADVTFPLKYLWIVLMLLSSASILYGIWLPFLVAG